MRILLKIIAKVYKNDLRITIAIIAYFNKIFAF